MRELYSNFEIERVRDGSETKYRLIKQLENKLNREQISNRVRAWVLRDKRCAQCGKTPAEDGVKLHVDHKIPQAWGGTNEPDNLQALCADCNEGKKNLYATYDEFADKIKVAANFDQPQKRMRELRVLGWQYSFIKKKEAKRFKTYFILEHYEPWPEGNIASEIRKLESQK
jgi:5-methylcytosine-specific restriction endonuclease McrA